MCLFIFIFYFFCLNENCQIFFSFFFIPFFLPHAPLHRRKPAKPQYPLPMKTGNRSTVPSATSQLYFLLDIFSYEYFALFFFFCHLSDSSENREGSETTSEGPKDYVATVVDFGLGILSFSLKPVSFLFLFWFLVFVFVCW